MQCIKPDRSQADELNILHSCVDCEASIEQSVLGVRITMLGCKDQHFKCHNLITRTFTFMAFNPCGGNGSRF